MKMKHCKRLRRISKTALAAFLFSSFAGHVLANTIFSDDFGDGNRDGWYRYAKNADSSLSVSGRLELSSANTDVGVTNNFAAVRPFDAVDMTVVGARIKLQLDFLTLEDQVLNRGIAIGLYHSEGTPIISDTSSGTVGENDSGWFTIMRRNTFMHRLYEDNGKGILETATGLANRAEDITNTAIRVGGSPTGPHVAGVNSGIWYTYRLEIEAIEGSGDGEVDHRVTVTLLEGSTSLSTMTYTDGGALVTNIDQVGVVIMAGNDLAIDNVSVEVLETGMPDITEVAPAGGSDWDISYVGVVGTEYILQETTGLVTNAWTDVGSSFVCASGTNIVSLASSAAAAFWRLRAFP